MAWLTLLVHIKLDVLIVFAEKYEKSFCFAKAVHIVSEKNGSVFAYNAFENLTSC